ncbi:hypothetical protein CRUP_024205, partial [Coryphaenoides rupestris]
MSRVPQCDSMTLATTPNVRRGSTPLPIKHQLRREEAVHEDCDWTLAGSGGAGPSPPPISFSPAPGRLLDGVAGLPARRPAEDRPAGPERGEGYVRSVTVDEEESTIIIYDNWKQVSQTAGAELCPRLCTLTCQPCSARLCVLVFSVTDRRSFHRTAQLRLLLRETQPQTPIILVGNKSDLVRSREVSSQEAVTSAALFQCLYLEISASLGSPNAGAPGVRCEASQGPPSVAPGRQRRGH